MTSTTMELAEKYADVTGDYMMLDFPNVDDVVALNEARAELHQRIKELERDAKRLDCWEATNSVFRVANTWYYKAGWNHPAQRYNSLREALDRAMSEGKP